MRLLAWAWLVVGGLAVLAPNAHAAGAKADVIEDVNSKQLENLVADSDYVAVFWYKKGCKDCDKVLEELENIDDDTDRFGVHFVKIADKKFAKAHGVKTFPALSFFRNKEPIHYEGDLMDESGVLEFLTSLEAMELPDQIEEVNAKILDKIVEEQEFVAVLFYKNECRRCVKALQELENVDDDADQLGIAFVKINDPELADEYSLGSLPALVYYRRRIPVVYDGDLMNEDKVLEWLVENKNTGDDDDVIDDVTLGLLNTLIDSLDHLAVVFYDREDSDDTMILQELENIDDDLDAQGIHIVKIADDVAEREYGIEDTPCLVYFEKEIPSLYDGDLHKEQEVLAWLVEQLHTDEIEDITDEMLDKLIRESSHLAVLFYKEDEQDSELVVTELENIDDDCDARGISFVKIDNDDEAKEYGIDVLPTLVYFEKGVPSVYSGNLLVEEQVLDWLVHQVEEDEIEEVTDEMLDRLIERTEHLAVLFYDKESRRSRKVVAELENIDDECDGRGVYFVKIDNYEEAMEYGIDTIPTLVYFESEIPYIFEGDLMKEEEVLYWLFHHVDHEEIADVTDEMLGKLIANEPFLAVLFYDKDDAEDHEVLGELENIDDDCEQAGVPFVKIDNDAEAREYGIDDLPTLVYFENRIPSIYEGDLSNEQEVLEWLLEQKNSDTIEEVTDEILDDLIANFEYVVVYFSGECDEGQKCDHILNELENIDDDTDDHGMHFVTTEETGLANNYGIKVFPALAIFRNGEPLLYKGDLTKEEAVLKWVTAEDTLQIPNQIEEVNQRMLERILNTSDNVAVFFYDENDKKSRKILIELENIDDDCDDIGIDFVKISDEGIAQEYDIASMPAIVYFRHRFPQIYEGDMTDEEALLEWLIDNKDRGPASIIEEVDGKMLQNLVDTFEFLVVYFYDDNCPTCETILAELETIDDETDEVGIQFVKTNDVDVAEDLGISHLPALVYFEGGVPSIYDGDFARGAEVLSWLVAHTRHIDASLEALTSRLVVPGGAQKAGEGGGGSEGERTGVAEELEDDSADSSAQKMYDDNGDATAQDDIDDDAIDDDSSDTNAQDYSEDDDTLDGDNDDATAEDNGDDNDTVDDDGDDGDDASAQDDSEDDNAVDDDDNNDATPQDDSEDDDAIDDDGTTAQSNSDDDNTVDDDDDDDSSAQDDSENDDTVDDDDDDDDSTAQDDSEDDDTVEDDDRDGNDNNSECVCGQMCDEEKHVESQDEDFQHMKSDERENKTVGAIKEEINEEPDKIDNEGDSYTGEIGSEDMQTVVISGEDEIEEHDYKAEESGNKSSIEDGNDEVKDGAGEKQVNKIVKRKKEVKTQKRSSKKDDKITDNKKNEKDISTVNETVSGSVKTFNVARHAHPIPKVEKKVRNNSNKTGKSYAAKGRKRRFEEQAEAAGSDIQAEQDVLEWLIEQRHEDTIENINRQMLYTLIDTQDYLAVYFFNEENDECPKVLRTLEKIDDEAAEYGIQMVKMNDRLMAKKYGFRNPPGLVYFRKAKHIKYDGDLYDEEDVLDWLTAPENMELNDAIEKVNRKMFERLRQTTDYLAVFFYSEVGCKQCQKVLAELENIDDEADANGIDFVKIDDAQLAKDVGVYALPAIVFYRSGSEEPIIYAGDMKNEENLLSWLLTEKDPTADFIEDMSGEALQRVIRDADAIAVYFYRDDSSCATCLQVLEELENIDDDTDRIGVSFVKTQDLKVAERYGVTSVPALLYFEHQVPTVYEGDLLAEEDVLQWLTLQKTEDTIETVNRNMLEVMLEDTQYLAVFFYKPNCRACETVLAELENIDDECDVYGIHMVKIQDAQLAKRYGIKTLPALIYFRNGNPLIFDGDMQNEGSVLEWLKDDDNRDLDGEIEAVNGRMLKKLMDESPFMAVFFYEDDCSDCEQVLRELENIDEEVDMFGIDFVKINDPDAAHRFNIIQSPALVYFRKKVPLVYDGDLLDEEKVFQWLTSQDVFEIKDEIEEVNRKMLEKLLDENDFVAVYFYDDTAKCDEVLVELEKIDDETDDLDITFVKIRDTRYAKKYGIQKLPALVYFRRRFPSIYRGDLMVEEEVLDWLQKNRFKHPELNLFMYATGAITLAFILYTLFLIFCFRTPPHQKAA